jgi:hypothetical protein
LGFVLPYYSQNQMKGWAMMEENDDIFAMFLELMEK